MALVVMAFFKTNNYFSRSLAMSFGKNLKINKAGLAFCPVGLIHFFSGSEAPEQKSFVFYMVTLKP